MRTPIVAGNWKMNKNSSEAKILAEQVVTAAKMIKGVDIVLCPPFTSLSVVCEVIKGTDIKAGAQNMHWEISGAYTGEISANMLLTLGCEYVILGHSERRAYFGETDEIIAKKVKAAIESGLTPIVCVGETLAQRESGITEKIVGTQLKGAFAGLTKEKFTGTVIAYEPVWAIGTGKTASVQQAQDVHRFIRGLVEEMFGHEIAEKTRIQYGGSVKPSNAAELFAQPDIDGGLIGGAALDSDSFLGIVKGALI